ncbi:hypothetical protein D3C72_841970 [compost metagenome]
MREWRIEVVLAEVVPAEVAPELLERQLEAVVLLVVMALDLAGVFVGVADIDLGPGQYQQLLGVTPQPRGAALHITVERLALLDAGGVGEDHIRRGGSKVTPLLRIAGLEDDRLALWRALDVQRPHHREVLALVVQGMHPAGVEELPGGPVAREGAVFIGAPQALHHRDMLLGAGIAGVVVVVLVTAIVAGGAGVATGDHVPAGAALADKVQRGEAAGDVEGFVVGSGQGADQADVACAYRQRRKQGQRLQTVEVMGRRAGGDVLAVDDEHQVEQRRLGLAGDVDVPVDVDAGVGRQLRVEPQVVPARAAAAHGQGTELDLAGHGKSSVKMSPVPASSRARPLPQAPHRS